MVGVVWFHSIQNHWVFPFFFSLFTLLFGFACIFFGLVRIGNGLLFGWDLRNLFHRATIPTTFYFTCSVFLLVCTVEKRVVNWIGFHVINSAVHSFIFFERKKYCMSVSFYNVQRFCNPCRNSKLVHLNFAHVLWNLLFLVYCLMLAHIL